MSSETPQWVVTSCRRWGDQKRRIWSGADWHGNIDGYAQSLLGRMREERDGAAQCEIVQHWPEVFWGDGLEVQRSLPKLPELPHGVLHLHYVFDPEWGLTAGKKAALIEISVRSYWDELKKAEYWIFSRLSCAHTSETEIPQKIERLRLKLVKNQGTRGVQAIASPNYPPVDLSALKRKVLSVP